MTHFARCRHCFRYRIVNSQRTCTACVVAGWDQYRAHRNETVPPIDDNCPECNGTCFDAQEA